MLDFATRKEFMLKNLKFKIKNLKVESEKNNTTYPGGRDGKKR